MTKHEPSLESEADALDGLTPIGHNIARARAAKKWSQSDLAERMPHMGAYRWQQRTVSRIEHGQSPGLQEIGHLVRLLGPEILDNTIEQMLLKQTGGWFRSKASEQAIDELRSLAQQLQDKINELDLRLTLSGDPDEH